MTPRDSRKKWQPPHLLRSISSDEMSRMMQELQVKGYFGLWTDIKKLTCSRSTYNVRPNPGGCGVCGIRG